MPIRKNIKISSTKRGHHERQKKNFLKSKKQLHREKQVKENIFKKSKNEQKQQLTDGKISKPKKANKRKASKGGNGFPEVERDEEINIADFNDMLSDNESKSSDEDEDIAAKRQKIASSESGNEFSDDDDDESAESDEDEEVTENMELQQRQVIKDENKFKRNTKELLPIKTKTGVVQRAMQQQSNSNAELIDSSASVQVAPDDEDDDDEISPSNEVKKPIKKSILSVPELLSEREREFTEKKIKIGRICSSITEKPEDKIGSLRTLIEFMQENGSDKEKNLLSVRKLALLSLAEVFKDIIPEYKIGIIDLENQKVKKDTLARITYENELLRYYKKYLKEVENVLKALKPGKYSKRPTKEKIYIAEIAVQSLCELLLMHQNFNFSTNIAQLLVLYLNCSNSKARKVVNETFIKIFKTDKRLDLTRHIVRHINHLVKKKSSSVYSEVLTCLLALQIKNINVDAEKEAELKQKKMEQHKSRLISMSKRERKRKKKLADLEKEMMETHAEENKQTKNMKLTEISKLVFTIYFRILKETPKAKVLSYTLEGLAKFAHIINIEFFSDLIEVLNHLIENADLGYREQLHCIQTVFAILSGQGEALTIDPARFYTHLYRNILCINAGKNHQVVESVISTLENVLIRRRKNITHLRYLAFLKRLMSLSIHVQQNGALGCLSIIKNAMQLNSSLDILLDTENKVGSGKFDPNIEEPEFSSANCTSFFELGLLKRHYHPIVVKMADYISKGCKIENQILGPELTKLSPIDFYSKYDSSEMAFNPAIPAPSTKEHKIKKMLSNHIFKISDVKEICDKLSIIEENDCKLNFDFSNM